VNLHVLERSQWVPAPADKAFAIFSDPACVSAFLPRWLQIQIVTPLPAVLHEGAVFDYELALHRVALRCRARISEWKPGTAIKFEQVEGPFARWTHRHTFRPERGGTRLGDRTEYALPLDPFSRPVNAFYVRPLLERVLEHRGQAVARQFRPVQLW
jgi:ligand-binding SRPBCC domain-containing protein